VELHFGIPSTSVNAITIRKPVKCPSLPTWLGSGPGRCESSAEQTFGSAQHLRWRTHLGDVLRGECAGPGRVLWLVKRLRSPPPGPCKPHEELHVPRMTLLLPLPITIHDRPYTQASQSAWQCSRDQACPRLAGSPASAGCSS